MSDPDLKTPSATLEAEAPDTATEETTHRRMTLNMGPQHPSTHGVLRVAAGTRRRNRVTARYPDIGFLHTGIEKQCEAKMWQQVVPLTDRVDYLANLSNNLCYALAVEKLLGITDAIPPMAQWMRVLLCELHAHQQPLRVAGHARARHRRDDGVLLLLPRARRPPAHLRDVLRPAADDQLHPDRRSGAGAAARLGEDGHGRSSTRSPRRWTNTRTCSIKNPIWLSRTQGVGVDAGRGADRLRRHRTDAPRGRHRAGTSARTSRTRATRSSISRCPTLHRERCVRAVPGSHRRDAGERADREAGARRHADGSVAGGCAAR